MSLFLGAWKDSSMAMFTAIFDGSGSPNDTAAVVVAGFVGKVEQWIELERNWKDCLNDFGVSAMHMREFAHSVGEFASWKDDEQRRRRFLSRLISIIQTRVWHSFASAVIMEDYKKVDSKYCLSEFSKPYALAGCSCLSKLHNWATKWAKGEDGIQIVFEDGDEDKGDLMRAAKKHFGAAPAFLKKERSVAFQAADILAYEHLLANTKLRKSESGFLLVEELRHPLKELSKIPGGAPYDTDWGFHQEDNMTASCIADGIPLRNPA